MRIGLYGGSFNPIHVGHIGLARHLLVHTVLDEIWMMVSPQNPLKQNRDLLDDHRRLETVRHALEGDTRLVASDYEMRLPRPSYTWNTLHRLAEDFPSAQFTLIIGADNWACMDRWCHGLEIAHTYPIVVYPREGVAIDRASLPPNVMLADCPLIDVSSTGIRSRIRRGLPITGLVPPQVEQEITDAYKEFPPCASLG